MKNLRNLLVRTMLAIGFVCVFSPGLRAEDETALSVSIQDHRFTPAELRAPAGKPIAITVKNLDATPEEFESKSLHVEKIVAGNSEIIVRLRPQKPGRYRFFGEYHEDTAKGELVVE